MATTIVLLALALVLVPLAIYKIVTRNFNYWKKRKVQYVKPEPLFGNFGNFFRRKTQFGIVVREIYETFPDVKYVGGFFGHQPIVVVRDPDLIKLIVAKDYYYFNSRGLSLTEGIENEPLNQNLFGTDGDKWRVLRQNMTPLFSSAKMKNMFHLMAQCGVEFEELVRRRQAESNELDVRDLVSRFTVDVIGACAFGLQTNSIKDEDSQFRRMGYKIFETTIAKSVRIMVAVMAPWIFDLLGFKLFDKSMEDFFVDLSRKMIASREGRPPERHDFIDLLAQLKQRGSIEGDSIESMKPGAERRTVSLALDDNLLAAQSFIFFAAGFETSSTTTSYALYELAHAPHIQTRLQAEIDTLLEKHGGRVDYEMVNSARYLDMVTSETLRKYPVLASITRQVTSRYTLPDGLVLEKGVIVHLPVYAIHHDAQHYAEPERFDPERFAPEAVHERQQCTYMPFGEGQRICIGMRFGKMQVMVGLVSLLRNFSVAPCSKTEADIEFDPTIMVTTPKHGIWLKLVPRNKPLV